MKNFKQAPFMLSLDIFSNYTVPFFQIANYSAHFQPNFHKQSLQISIQIQSPFLSKIQDQLAQSQTQSKVPGGGAKGPENGQKPQSNDQSAQPKTSEKHDKHAAKDVAATNGKASSPQKGQGLSSNIQYGQAQKNGVKQPGNQQQQAANDKARDGQKSKSKKKQEVPKQPAQPEGKKKEKQAEKTKSTQVQADKPNGEVEEGHVLAAAAPNKDVKAVEGGPHTMRKATQGLDQQKLREDVVTAQEEQLDGMDVNVKQLDSSGQQQSPDFNPMKAIIMHNLECTHNIQRRRDIKQNYKAKLSLEKLEQEKEKKRQAMMDLLNKRAELVQKVDDLQDRIGFRQGQHIDADMHLRYLEMYKNEDESPYKRQNIAENGAHEQGPQGEDKSDLELKIQLSESQQQDKGIDIFEDQTDKLRLHHEIGQTQGGKTHWDFLVKEMIWMADDFDKETKKKNGDAKRVVRACKKHLIEKQQAHERMIREQKIELKRKSKYMSNIVQLYWKSCEKILRHNYNVEYEKKRQQMRTKKLENFVAKHLKLSVKVAETLKTKQFIKKSQINKDDVNMLKPEEEIAGGVFSGGPPKPQRQPSEIQKEGAENQESDKQSVAEQSVEMAQNFQPMGHTLDKAQVSTKVPFILRGSLREYQIIGLDWMVTLHNRKLNGILADEMGLGKTIQTISLLASLACDKGVWGPHLIVVPTTIIMNWEIEFKKWCPGFKILTYFGTQKERKIKRHGWSKDNSFHICITSYKLVIQDHFAFRRKKWYYMVLDEAQNIKNFKSQRWQTLLRFNTKRRLLLTGTPLQNDVMELWSLMHFLMPQIFSNQQDFKEWFQNPFSQSINQNKSLNLRVVQKLQSILRPFLLRRMKRDVEKQLPEKIEHIVQCNLSRRQRLLYDEYINHDKTRDVLADSDFFSIMSILMQLRKVCNHPDLFEARTIESPFILSEEDRIRYDFPTFMLKDLDSFNYDKDISLSNMCFRKIDMEGKSKLMANRQIELIPGQGLDKVIYRHRRFLPHDKPFDVQHLMSQRPFQESLALGLKSYSNFNELHPTNCHGLNETLPNLLPYDQDRVEQEPPIQTPHYLNAACLPFIQHFFSHPPQKTHGSSPGTNIETLKSAVQEEDQKMLLVHLARKLALWHSIDRQNRLQILHGVPLYGQDLRELIAVNLVCKDIFDSKTYKYVSSKRYRKCTQSGGVTEVVPADLYNLPQSVFSPTITSRLFRSSDQVEESEEEEDPDIIPLTGPEDPIEAQRPPRSVQVAVSCWPIQNDDEIDECNKNNMLIKEITMIKLKELLIQKNKREREERLKQPKRVIRRRQLVQESEEEQFLITIDAKGLGLQEHIKIKDEAQQKEKEQEGKKDEENIEDNKAEEKKYDKDQEFDQEILDKLEANQGEEKEQVVKEKIDMNTVAKEELQGNENKENRDSPNDQEVAILDAPHQENQESSEHAKILEDLAAAEVVASTPAEPNQSEKPDENVEKKQDKEPDVVKSETIAAGDKLDQPMEVDKIEKMEVFEQYPSKEDEGAENSSPSKHLLDCGPRMITKTKYNTKVYEEVITYKEYLQEQKDKGDKNDEIDELDSDFEEKQFLKEQQENALRFPFGADVKTNSAAERSDYIEANGITYLKGKSHVLSVSYKNTMTLKDLIVTPTQRATQMDEIVKNFKVILPKCVSKPVEFIPSKIYTKHQKSRALETFMHQKLMLHKTVSQSLKYSNILFFPHKNLIQYDCGKLQRLAQLLKNLYNKGSKVIIFTQMTKMLDIFEQFLNLHGYIYVRLDGSVRTDHRQRLVDRFNYNKKIFCFISSTRCGGVGINLTGADCVVFYDTDWNPAMDKQAQDRCHRIGQTKTVHIYRLISVNTIEENIFKKSLQKRELGGLIIEGNFNQEFFQKVSVKDILQLDGRNGLQVPTSQLNELLQPKRLDILKHENIQFHGCSELEGELGAENEIILRRPLHDDQEEEDKQQNEDDHDQVDFEAKSEDLEEQAREMERQRQAEQYRRRFEEALMRIEDQEDVAAMQNAQREQNDNDDEEMCEFVTMAEEGATPTQTVGGTSAGGGFEGEESTLKPEGEEEASVDQKTKEQQMLDQQLQLQRQREAQAKQKINDGISLTQAEIKKNEQIDWHANPNLNLITKRCLDFYKDNFDFEDYLDDRATKDPKFVRLEEDDDKDQDGNRGNVDGTDGQKSDSSEFSFSDEEEGGAVTTANESRGPSSSKRARKNWDREAAEDYFKVTRTDILDRLYRQGDDTKASAQNQFSQMNNFDEEDGGKDGEQPEPAADGAKEGHRDEIDQLMQPDDTKDVEIPTELSKQNEQDKEMQIEDK